MLCIYDEQLEVSYGISDSNSDEDFSDKEEFVDLQANPRHKGIKCDIPEISSISVIKKIRNMIVMLRRSSTKNDILKKYVATELEKQIHLIIDCKTKWNCLLIILKRFYLLNNCMQKTLINICLSFALYNDEIKIVSIIINALV